MPLIPFDEDLLAPLAQSWFTVALAGIIGAGITLRSLWYGPHAAQPAGLAEARKNGLPADGNDNDGTGNGANAGTDSKASQRAYADLR